MSDPQRDDAIALLERAKLGPMLADVGPLWTAAAVEVGLPWLDDDMRDQCLEALDVLTGDASPAGGTVSEPKS